VPAISDSGRNFSDDSHLNGTGYRKFYLETDWSRFLTTPANAEARVAQLRATLWKN
jgi:hypothetical protein